jgi:elongation factor G
VSADPDTGQTLIAGMGELHLGDPGRPTAAEFGVGANVGKPQVSYRETIKGEAKAEGRFIRQTGGRGQYGHVKIRVAPAGRRQGFRLRERHHRRLDPEGIHRFLRVRLREAMEAGILAGYAMRDVKSPCTTARITRSTRPKWPFKIASSMAFKDACRAAGMGLLEPVMKVEVVVPEEYMGDVIGDLNARRGRIVSMESRPGLSVILSIVPLADPVRLCHRPALSHAGAGNVYHALFTVRRCAQGDSLKT